MVIWEKEGDHHIELDKEDGNELKSEPIGNTNTTHCSMSWHCKSQTTHLKSMPSSSSLSSWRLPLLLLCPLLQSLPPLPEWFRRGSFGSFDRLYEEEDGDLWLRLLFCSKSFESLPLCCETGREEDEFYKHTGLSWLCFPNSCGCTFRRYLPLSLFESLYY